jgi:hypothetical protein
MRRLIEKTRESRIVCDNTQCDYELPYLDEKQIVKYINMPCPKCEENLLTEEDFLQHEKLMSLINWINKWFSWITFFYSKNSWSKRKTFSVCVYDGVKIKNEK